MSSPGPIAREIEDILRANYYIQTLEIIDESHKHKNHAGYNPQGESHFRIRMISPDFAGLSRIEQQRAVQKSLDHLLKTRIHALSLQLKAN